LSPLFTVAAYALLFGVSYSTKTYVSLLPLTIGVMLACSFEVSASNTIGLLCAFGSALVFVSSNIFFKKIMPSNTGGISSSSHKLDKMNLLLYSSGMAFLLMIPIWVYYDLPLLWAGVVPVGSGKGGPPTHSVTYYFFMNGTVHYAQNIIAFVILSSTSPVTYSIASLIKRVAVICIAIVWFNQSVHPIQAFGIAMTFTGLYMYNNAKDDVEKGEKKLRRLEANREMMLPTTKADDIMLSDNETPPLIVQEYSMAEALGIGSGTVYGRTKGSPHTQQYHRPPPASNLHIKTSENIPTTKETVGSPVDLYPSPPLSDDSPPSQTILLPPAHMHSHQERDNFHSHHHHTHHLPPVVA
jgi:solute carrier family 35 protein E1